MTPTAEQFSELIAKMMGKCWHEWFKTTNKSQRIQILKCSKCGKLTEPTNKEDRYYPAQFSAVSNNEISYETRKWFEKELPEVWKEYIYQTVLDPYVRAISGGEIIGGIRSIAIYFNLALDYRNLWAYLAGCKKKWGYKDCKNHGLDEYFIVPCKDCHGTGKIKSPALEFMEVSE